MLTNKYSKIYYKIISNALTKNYEGYVEEHHILPKSLNGTDDSSNLVKLTAREHFICHLLLTKFTIGKEKNKMLYAVWGMINLENKNQDRYKVNSRMYQVLREQYSTLVKERLSGKPGRQHSEETKRKISEIKTGKSTGPMTEAAKENLSKSMQGKNVGKKRTEAQKQAQKERQTGVKKGPHSEETKKKISTALSGKTRGPMNDDHKRNLSESHKGKVKSKEHCKKISDSLKGTSLTAEQRENFLFAMESGKSECEYCGFKTTLGNYRRWHGINCKHKINL